jgi:ammonium transporter Rh
MFGAYFGLAVAYMIGKPTASTETEGGHLADMFSLIGTIFLWIYWPSFNGGALPTNSAQQQRAIINTIFSLSGATIASFIASSWLSHDWKLRPVDIQNATLAGGVAIGAICHLTLNLSHCILIGFAAGLASTYGFARVQGVLDTWGLHDTCGVNNLHGIPSLIGGVASVILLAYKGKNGHDMPDVITEHDQWKDQWAAIAMTLALSIPSGLIVGFLMSLVHPHSGTEFYSDTPYWEVLDDFGRSHESEIQKNLDDLEAGLEASRSLRAIIAKYATLGFQPGLDFSVHSKRSYRPDNASSDHDSVRSGSENEGRAGDEV